MRIKLVKIGNSVGIRLPKAVIDECELKSEVDMEIRQRHIILSPVSGARRDWPETIAAALKENPASEEGEWQW
ncbi:MAG: AbrB/MazE/SpoVT family DNA-binding domain-containing protein [Alphaproteobacteria bacterium]|nr:AbrB/MazE/SpoVT family DNA-binding domain-containing protein [Alphaproteobacteria bacterium]